MAIDPKDNPSKITDFFSVSKSPTGSQNETSKTDNNASVPKPKPSNLRIDPTKAKDKPNANPPRTPKTPASALKSPNEEDTLGDGTYNFSFHHLQSLDLC